MERYRRAPARRNKIESKTDFKTKIRRQSVVCVAILCIVMIVSVFKTDTATAIINRVQNSVSYTVDYKASVSKLFAAINRLTKGNGVDVFKEFEKTD